MLFESIKNFFKRKKQKKEKLEYVKSKANTYRQSSRQRTDNYHTNADYSHSSSDCCSSSSGSDCCNSND